MNNYELISLLKPHGEPEKLSSLKFTGMEWWNIAQLDEIVARTNISLDGLAYSISDVGFQESVPDKPGIARWHKEDEDEWVMPVKGAGDMFIGDSSKNIKRVLLRGVLSIDEIAEANFALIKLRDLLGSEVFGLEILSKGKKILVPAIKTPKDMWHGTTAYKNESMIWVVVKGSAGIV